MFKMIPTSVWAFVFLLIQNRSIIACCKLANSQPLSYSGCQYTNFTFYAVTLKQILSPYLFILD